MTAYSSPPHNLPAQPTPFIGRADEIAQIISLLNEDTCRLLTLLGPGGIGKSRLAIEVARQVLQEQPLSGATMQFSDGVYYVSLQSLSAPEYIIPAIVDAMQIGLSGEEHPRKQLLYYLQDKDVLLILDTLEHLLSDLDLLSEMIGSSSNVKLLVTSRERLNLREEWAYEVSGMDVPKRHHADELEDSDAVQLFVDHARRMRPDFKVTDDSDAVIQICQLVEGMPLALELAAMWLKVLPCREIVTEIQNGLDILATNTRNVPERHRSMTVVFRSSWQLLSEEDQQVFEYLSIFRGSFSRDAAERVAGASLLILSSLVDKSFIRVNAQGRYDIHELMRQYAAERLARFSKTEEIQTRHALYYADFLHRYEGLLKGSGQITALDDIEAELDNIQVAWQWMVQHRMEDALLHSMESHALYYSMRSRHIEGYLAFSMAVKHFEKETGVLPGYLLTLYGWFCLQSGETSPNEGSAIIQRGVSLLKSFGVQKMLVLPIMRLIFHAKPASEHESLRQLYLENLDYFRQQNDRWGEGWSLRSLGILAHVADQNQEALPLLQESLEISRESGDGWGACWSLGPLGLIAELQKNFVEAQEFYRERFSNIQAIGDLGGVAWTHGRLAAIAYNLHDMDQFKDHLFQILQMALQSSDKSFLVWALYTGVLMFATEGQDEQAHKLLTQLTGEAPAKDWIAYVSRLSKELFLPLEPSIVTDVTREQVEKLQLRQVARALLAELAPQQTQIDTSDFQSSDQPLIDPLSERELEVLYLIAEGLQNQEIADKLYIVKGTVKAHINTIYRKLDVRNRVEAVAKAQEFKLL